MVDLGPKAPSDAGAAVAKPTVREIFEESSAFVWRTLRYLGVAESNLGDASQEVFLVVHRKLPDFEGRSSIRTWLYGICLRVARGSQRKAHHRREQLTDQPPPIPTDGDQDVAVEREQIREQLKTALDSIGPKKREVFVLHEIEELPLSEIATILDLPMGTVYSRHRGARLELQSYLRRQAALRSAP